MAHEKIIRKEAKERERKEDIKFVGSRTVSPLQCLFSFVWNVCGLDLLTFFPEAARVFKYIDDDQQYSGTLSNMDIALEFQVGPNEYSILKAANSMA